MHRGFSCSFCILSWWHTLSCNNILLPSHDCPYLTRRLQYWPIYLLAHANPRVAQTAAQIRVHFVELHSLSWISSLMLPSSSEVSCPLQILLAAASLTPVLARLPAQPATSLPPLPQPCFYIQTWQKTHEQLQGCPLRLSKGLASFWFLGWMRGHPSFSDCR